MTDRTTKILLLVVALGLWANAMVPLFRPMIVSAQDRTQQRTLSSIDDHLSNVEDHLDTIEHDVHNLADIEDGSCTNDKIC
jgi:hypothetical protein